jgi:hypothetical protein
MGALASSTGYAGTFAYSISIGGDKKLLNEFIKNESAV